jgi:hypothetical protein
MFMVMMLNAISNNISLISWRSILLTGETSVPGENHQPVTSHWQTLSYNVVHLPWAGFELTTLVMIGTDWIGSCNPTTIRSWPQQPLINFKTILKLKKSFYSNSNFLLVFLKIFYWWRVGDCLFGIYHISVLFIISHWLEIYRYSSFTKTLIAVALQSKGVLYKKSASFLDGNSSESIDPTTVI